MDNTLPMSKQPPVTSSESFPFSTKLVLVLLASTFAISLAFYLMHARHLDHWVQTTKLVTEISFENEDPSQADYLSHIERKASSLLKLRQVDAIGLMDSKSAIIFEQGAPLNTSVLTKIREGAKTVREGNYLVETFAIPGKNTSKYILIVEFDQSSHLLMNMQLLAVCALVIFGVFLITQYLKNSLNKEFFEPLDAINDELSKNNRQGILVPVQKDHDGVYRELVQHLNESCQIQQARNEEYRKNTENATQELRESLETIEIKNIDLDISRKNAVELNKLKSEFLKKTSQDLLTPLRGILSFSKLIKNYPLNTDQKEFLSTIEDSTHGMLSIVNDISDFSKLESGKLQLEQKPVNLRSCIESSLTLQAPTAINAEVELYSTFDPKLSTNILGDSLRIQQVVSNLVANAVKFDGANYVQVRVELIDSNEDDVEIAIRIQTDGQCPKELELWQDQETGIRDLNSAFYSRAGMGLIVAKGLSQHMKGNVFFESNEDLRVFSLEINCARAKEHKFETRAIDAAYNANAVVFSNSDRGYREIASRLSELYIKNHRASSFDEVINIAKRLKDNRQKHARYLPVAIIEAQTSDQTLDKIVLTQTLDTVSKELAIPTLVVSPMGRYDTLQRALSGLNIQIFQRPIDSSRFQKYVLDLLGIVKLKTETVNDSMAQGPEPIKILVVDDNLANVKLSKALLADFNVETSTACSGGDAIALAKKEAFDLIFMDIELPDISGYEATKLIRESESQDIRTPVVALTAHDVIEEKRNILLGGMDDVVGKPLTTKDISIVLDRWAISPHLKTDARHIPAPVIESDPEGAIASPVNIAECLNLSKNNADLAKDMLKMLLGNLPDDRRKVSESAMNSDLDELYEIIHKLHGACCYCGVPRLRLIAKELDHQLKDRNRDNLVQNLEELYEAMDELFAWHASHDVDALFE